MGNLTRSCALCSWLFAQRGGKTLTMGVLCFDPLGATQSRHTGVELSKVHACQNSAACRCAQEYPLLMQVASPV